MSTLFNSQKQWVRVNIQGANLKTTDKAVLFRINDMTRWIPRAVFEYAKDDHMAIDLEKWFFDKMNQKGAIFSDDGTRRLMLYRIWDESKKIALCVGLNPSAANADQDDHTIKLLSGYMTEMGFGGFRMVNLFSIISSDPAILLTEEAKKNEDADLGIVFGFALMCQEIIFCWGAFEEAKGRAKRLVDFFSDAKCFGVGKDGSPWHPRACHYAKWKAEDARLFKYNEHEYGRNLYKAKPKKRASEFTHEQYQLLLQG